MTPHERSRHCPTPDSAEIRLFLNPDLFWFRGHFPVQPLLPGVAQLEWVMHYAREVLGITAAFHRLQQVKFQTPLLPEDEICLQLSWQADKQLLGFSYLRQQANGLLPASSGKIRLCP